MFWLLLYGRTIKYIALSELMYRKKTPGNVRSVCCLNVRTLGIIQLYLQRVKAGSRIIIFYRTHYAEEKNMRRGRVWKVDAIYLI